MHWVRQSQFYFNNKTPDISNEGFAASHDDSDFTLRLDYPISNIRSALF